MLLFDAFERNCQKYPQKTIVKSSQGQVTYSRLWTLSQKLANYFTGTGLQRGDRVVIYLDNSIETCVAILGTLFAGGVFVVVNPTTKWEKLRYIIQDCAARALVTSDKKYMQVFQNQPDWPSSLEMIVTDRAVDASSNHAVSLEEIYRLDASPVHRPRIIDVDLAALIYTSGSTGNPKGVMMTHHNMVSAADSIITYLENVPSDIVLNALPMSFDYGLYQFLMTMTFGGTLILEKDFTYPAVIVNRILEEHVTGFPGVPTMFALLFKWGGLEKYDFSGLRYISNTGAALPEEFIRKLRRMFPKTRIYSMYGLTECKRVSYLPPEDIDRKPTSVGVAMPNSEVYIVDDDGRPVGPGQVGELIVRGSNVMQGYWNLPEETAKVLIRGKHPYERALRTGDLFKMDKDGYLYFVARKDDIIKSKGEKVSPKEIENVLYELPGVEEAAVIGVDDRVLGQAVKAFIKKTPQSALTERDVLQHCTQHLENFCVPKYVEFLDELPKSSNGKIDKKRLMQLVEA